MLLSVTSTHIKERGSQSALWEVLSWGKFINQSASSCEMSESHPFSSTQLLGPISSHWAYCLLTGLTASVSPSPTRQALCRQVNLARTPPSRHSSLRTHGRPALPPSRSPMIPPLCLPLALGALGGRGSCTYLHLALDPVPHLSFLFRSMHSNPACPVEPSSQHTFPCEADPGAACRHLCLQSPPAGPGGPRQVQFPVCVSPISG